MKHLLKGVLILLTTFVLSISAMFFGCATGFKNPGDTLGGGGVGVIPDEQTTEEVEGNIGDNANNNDLSDLSNNSTLPNSYSTNVTTITEAGDYLLSGTFTEQYKITINLTDSTTNNTVHLYLDGLNITATDDVGLYIKDSNSDANVVITLVEDSENTIVANSTDSANTKNHAMQVKTAGLSINGSGTLNLTSTVSEKANGLKTDGALKIVDSNINISSNNHAITAETIIAQNCAINISSAVKDGLNAECADSITEYTTNSGYVELKNVNFTANVDGDGIQADSYIYISSGTYNITTNGQFVSKTTANMEEYGLVEDDFKYILSGSDYKRVASDYNGNSTTYALTQSCKAIKVGEISYEDTYGNEIDVTEGDYTILITGGTFTISSTDDAIHANSGDVLINGGTFNISTYDDAITADYLTQIEGGNITVTKSYEGIEGSYVEIDGGTISIVSQDDAINAATDYSGITPHIIISGGDIVVDATGDGIDSNGSILISGGKVIVHGPNAGADAGMDADSGIIVNGGTLYVSSSLGMVETPATNSTQYVISFAQSTTISAGTIISIVNSANETLLEVTTTKSCQSIIMSLPDFVKGESISVYGGDTKLATATISSIITSIGSSGSSQNPGGNRK